MSTLTHRFVSAVADTADATLVQPSNWNDTHVFANTAPNLVLAGPVSGADAEPTFRALVAADVPFVAGASWTVLTAATTITSAQSYLTVITTNQDFTLPSFVAGDRFIVSNSPSSAGTARIVTGTGNTITGLSSADNLLLPAGYSVMLVARSTTQLDAIT